MQILIGIVIGVVLGYFWRKRSEGDDDLWAGFDTLQATGVGAAQDIAQRATSAAQQVGQQASAAADTVRSQAASAAPQAAGAVQGGAAAIQRAKETAQQVAERLAAKQAEAQQGGTAEQAAEQAAGERQDQADQGAGQQTAGDSGSSSVSGGQPSEGQDGRTATAQSDALDAGHESQDVAVDTSPLTMDADTHAEVRQQFAWLGDFGEGDIPRAAVLHDGDELEGWEQYVDISQPGQELIKPGAFGKHVPEGHVYVARSRVPEDVWYRLIRLEAQ